MPPILKSALILGEFIATVVLAASLIIIDAVLLSYWIARTINWLLEKPSKSKSETVTVLGYDKPGDWGTPRKAQYETERIS